MYLSYLIESVHSKEEFLQEIKLYVKENKEKKKFREELKKEEKKKEKNNQSVRF